MDHLSNRVFEQNVYGARWAIFCLSPNAPLRQLVLPTKLIFADTPMDFGLDERGMTQSARRILDIGTPASFEILNRRYPAS